jgi:FtsP/CotA-like multicopper oxidase with cupredoxin domain
MDMKPRRMGRVSRTRRSPPTHPLRPQKKKKKKKVDVLLTGNDRVTILHKALSNSVTLGYLDPLSDSTFTNHSFNDVRSYPRLASAMNQTWAQHGQRPADREVNITVDVNVPTPAAGGHGGHHAPSEEATAPSSFRNGIEWEEGSAAEMNAASNTQNVMWKFVEPSTRRTNFDIAWSFAAGSVQKIRIVNDRNSAHAMHHPLHIHGQRFVVLAVNGVRNPDPVYLDTVLLRTGDVTDLAVEMDHLGVWAIHCHILEHAESGMMFTFVVR